MSVPSGDYDNSVDIDFVPTYDQVAEHPALTELVAQEGPWGAKSIITAYLEFDLPNRLVAFRNHWQMSADDLPNVESFRVYEPRALDQWPTVTTVQVRTKKIARSDYMWAGDPLYRVTYAMRTYIWVKAVKEPEVTRQRDRYTAVLRASFLDRLCMHTGPHAEEYHDISLDEGTLTEEYSDITPVKGDRYVAGSFLTYEFSLMEPMMRLPIGTITSPEIDVAQLQ